MAWFSSSTLLASQAPISRFKRNGEYIVEIRNARGGQSLSTTKNHPGWELTGRPGNERA